jgi:hypothetical protein
MFTKQRSSDNLLRQRSSDAVGVSTVVFTRQGTFKLADIIAPNASSGSERINAVVSIPLVQNIRQVTHFDPRIAVQLRLSA